MVSFLKEKLLQDAVKSVELNVDYLSQDCTTEVSMILSYEIFQTMYLVYF
jgi:hypothetical protein